MTKVQIIGPKSLLDDCIRTLHALAVVHIETSSPETTEDYYLKRLSIEKDKLQEKEFLEKASQKIRNLLQLLPQPQSYPAVRIDVKEINTLLEETAPVEDEIRLLRTRLDSLTEERSLIEKYEKLLRAFAPVVPRLGGLKNVEVVGLTIVKTREDVPGLLRAEVERITEGTCEIFLEDIDESSWGVVLAYPRRFDAGIKGLLTGRSITEVRLPQEYERMPLISALKEMGRKKAALPELISDAEGALRAISARWYGVFMALERAVGDAIDEIGALTYASQTRFSFVIEGWAPTETFPKLKDGFNETFGDKIMVRELEVVEKDYDLIPVYIKNPAILRPFEVFLSALPPPKYGYVDPTPYIALFFPAFFGLIVADIGYGAIILALSIFFKRRLKGKEKLRDIATVATVCGASAMVFGLLFGEFFGDLGVRLGIMRPLLLHRAGSLKTLLALTAGIGVGHVVLGFIIGAVNNIYRGRRYEAGAKIAHLASIFSLLLIAAALFDYLPRSLLTPGVIALIASVAILAVLEGVIGPLELIKSLGNMLSYVRIMAVGTASVVMATVANRIGGLSKDVMLGITVAAVIHVLNVMLSILSPSIQSMRLQYVEFLSKFYVGGGRRYAPFKKR